NQIVNTLIKLNQIIIKEFPEYFWNTQTLVDCFRQKMNRSYGYSLIFQVRDLHKKLWVYGMNMGNICRTCRIYHHFHLKIGVLSFNLVQISCNQMEFFQIS